MSGRLHRSGGRLDEGLRTAGCRTAGISSGTRPPGPCRAQQLEILMLRNLGLRGPAFPPSWLEPGALPQLAALSLEGNSGLEGTLPPGLPWPKIKEL